jgi:hypothetical protein
MIRKLLLAASLLTLTACGSAASYGLGEGDASYDELKKATADCKAKGGVIQLKDGGDSHDLSAYQCKVGKGS